LSERTGFSVAGIIKWEQGQREPTLTNAHKLAVALGVDCTAFTGEGEEKPVKRGRGRPKGK
jgi:transcriptional regulator with XRE-family HTH domain